MRILHTSDWHLGRSLYGRKRYDEFSAFLDWLAETIDQEQTDALLVAGDIFDTSAPSNQAQALYYQFLCRVAASTCRHVVVIGGNHDSPTFLNAPKELLRTLDVHVIGAATDHLNDEVILLRDSQNNPEALVCAVPYLRDRDIRMVEAGESIEDKERKLVAGIRNHYAKVVELAEQQRRSLAIDIPIIAMGHLFTAGGKTTDGDGVRELYVGSLAHVSAGIFPDGIDYLALGHLHVAQKVYGSEFKRYSGSPIPMGFGEARQEKSICKINFTQRVATVTLIKVPLFQHLERIHGNWQKISARILELTALKSQAWLEIIYDDSELVGNLRKNLDHAIANSPMEILRIKNNRIIDRILNRSHAAETLDELNPDDVFDRCLDSHEVPSEQRVELRKAYKTIANEL